MIIIQLHGVKVSDFSMDMIKNEKFYVNYKRAQKERYALFVVENIVVGAMKIESLEPVENKYIFHGILLGKENEIFDEYVNKPSPINLTRNPVHYLTIKHSCRCGCGKETDKDFIAGHDQRAIHQRISSQFKSVAEFIDWFDDHFG